ncbi:hypothetical protein LARI1_G003136 [Lachnellula arida]|uniref:Uncharacterized protein n=1 Tax=Lachnellula arida TaxID=1316785 RepID=A0A8T9BDU8_9HELO|nr:hypothetical protein LARI1_G003136 [Lachnellula arida]
MTIDRRKRGRIVPMRVDDSCLSEVLIADVIIGYMDTYHMMSASVENPLDCLLWQQAFAAKYDGAGTFGKCEWDQLLGHCQAVCDWPAIAFSEELLLIYPEAKVILPSRDVNSWHSSVLKTVYWRSQDPELRLASLVDWGAGLYYPMLKKCFETFFEGDFPNRGKAIFHKHYEEIRGLVPADNLLEYNVTQGWGPLCDFLGTPKPTDDFPRSNNVESFVSRCKSRNRRQIANGLLRYLVIGLCLALPLSLIMYLAN